MSDSQPRQSKVERTVLVDHARGSCSRCGWVKHGRLNGVQTAARSHCRTGVIHRVVIEASRHEVYVMPQ